MQLLFNIDLVNIAGVKVFVCVFTPQNCTAVDTHQWFLIINETVPKGNGEEKIDMIGVSILFLPGQISMQIRRRESHAIKQGEKAQEKINRWSHYWVCFLKDFTSFPSGARLRCFHLNDHDVDFFQRFLHLWRVFLIGNLLVCSEGRKKRIKSWIKNL